MGMVATVLLHIAVFVLLILLVAPEETPIAEMPNVSTFDVELAGPPSPDPPQEEQVESPPPVEAVIVPVAAIVLPTDNALPVSAEEQDAAKASGGGCDLTAVVQQALQNDENVELSLPMIASDRRSVANALALWNRVWVEPDRRLPPEALNAIIETVQQTVADASDACRLQIQRGPRLIYLPGASRTTVLALGSGQWTWQDVSDSSREDDGRTSSENLLEESPKNELEKLLKNIFGR